MTVLANIPWLGPWLTRKRKASEPSTTRRTRIVAPGERFLQANDICWLVAAYVFVLAPHADRLPWAVSVIGAALLLWRALIAGMGWRHPPAGILYVLVALASVGTWATYGRLWGRDAGVMLLICMMMLKILEMRTTREVTIAIYLGLFLVVTNFFYSQSLPMAGYMLVCLWLFFATMVGFNRIGQRPTLKERLQPAGKMLLFAIPLTVVLFLFFPRIQGPLWRMPDDQRSSRTGLSDTMQPGQISQLIRDESTAFTVSFAGPIPPVPQLYWRGPVMWNTDGREWRMPEAWLGMPQLSSTPIPLADSAAKVTYTVTTEMTNQAWVLGLDIPTSIPSGIGMSRDYQLIAQPSIRVRPGEGATRHNYTITSALSYRADEPRGRQVLRFALDFPANTNPRTRTLGENWKAQYPNPRDRIAEAVRMFEREFVYTLEPPTLNPLNPYDDFLFNTKRGFCEHYSGSFVLLMRAAGIPARVVTGYMGGEVNPFNRTLIVKQSDAHAWAEVYLEGEGWVRIDPTNAVAPTRIERGINAALGPVGMFGAFEAADPLGIIGWSRLQWSAFNYRWNQWVIGYNAEQQRSILARWGIDGSNWMRLTQWLIYGIFALSVGVGLYLLVRDHLDRRGAPLDYPYARFCARLAKIGLARRGDEGPRDYLARIALARPDLAPAARAVIERYEAIRYAGNVDPSLLAEFRMLVRRFSPSAKPA
jgi:protein-glutamine gamma-glutamyltransferase